MVRWQSLNWRASTIVTNVKAKTFLKNVANLTNIPYRWFHESARWLALKNKPDQAIKGLKSVAKFNGRCDEGEKIDIKVREYLNCGT